MTLTSTLLALLALAPDAGLPAPNVMEAAAEERSVDAGTVGRFAAMEASSRRELLTRAERLPLEKRVLAISEGFLDTPYVVSPLGEGDGLDADPRFRWDAVDCLTMVEQTLALALTPPVEDPDRAVLPVLDRIRYGTSVSYSERNHLMEAHWLPANLQKGFIRDVTRQVGGKATLAQQKVLQPRTWTSASSNALQLPKSRQALGEFPLAVLPIEAALTKLRAIPSGTLLLVVREDLPLKATRITHLGFVVQKKRRAYLRHAARNHYGRVIDEDLETFLKRNARYTKWKVTGVTLLEVAEPPVGIAQPE